MTNGDFKRIDAAKQFVCGIYKSFPGSLVLAPSDFGIKQSWDNLCYEPEPTDLPGLPPPPVSPFDGGQCCGTYYDTYAILSYTGKPNPGAEDKIGSFLLGKVDGIYSTYTSDGGSEVFMLRTTRCNGVSTLTDVLSVSSRDPARGVRITRVVAVSGPNNCGNPPATYPPSPPVPPGGYTSTPVAITNNDTTINNYVFNFYPPRTNDYPDNTFPPIEVNVVLDDPYADFDYKLVYNYDGTVDSSAVPKSSSLPSDVVTNIANTNNIVSGLGFLTTPPSLDDNPSVAKKVVPVDDSKNEDEEDLLGIKVTITTLPDKSHFGNPNVYFAGWIAFKLEDGYAPREQINFQASYFQAPPGARGWTCTFTNMSKGEVKVYSKKKD